MSNSKQKSVDKLIKDQIRFSTICVYTSIIQELYHDGNKYYMMTKLNFVPQIKSPKIGGYAIGGFCLIISISLIALPSIYITNVLILYNSFSESDQDALRNVMLVMLTYYGLTVSYFILLFAAGTLVILGTFFQKHKFLILHQIMTVVLIISLFLMLFRFPFIALIPVLLFTVLGIYFFISIQSLYASLKSQTQSNISNGHQNGH